MRKEKNKMDVLLELFWRKQNHEKEEIHKALFAWATHRDIQKSRPHPYNALQIPTEKEQRRTRAVMRVLEYAEGRFFLRRGGGEEACYLGTQLNWI